LRFNYCSFRYLCYPNELFWTEEGFFSWRYVDGKKGYATFKVKMLLLRKKLPSTTVTFLTTFQENKWLSSLIFNMPIIYMNITNNKDLISRSLRESYVAERKISKHR
jgi:hypothetical protein